MDYSLIVFLISDAAILIRRLASILLRGPPVTYWASAESGCVIYIMYRVLWRSRVLLVLFYLQCFTVYEFAELPLGTGSVQGAWERAQGYHIGRTVSAQKTVQTDFLFLMLISCSSRCCMSRWWSLIDRLLCRGSASTLAYWMVGGRLSKEVTCG